MKRYKSGKHNGRGRPMCCFPFHVVCNVVASVDAAPAIDRADGLSKGKGSNVMSINKNVTKRRTTHTHTLTLPSAVDSVVLNNEHVHWERTPVGRHHLANLMFSINKPKQWAMGRRRRSCSQNLWYHRTVGCSRQSPPPPWPSSAASKWKGDRKRNLYSMVLISQQNGQWNNCWCPTIGSRYGCSIETKTATPRPLGN